MQRICTLTCSAIATHFHYKLLTTYFVVFDLLKNQELDRIPKTKKKKKDPQISSLVYSLINPPRPHSSYASVNVHVYFLDLKYLTHYSQNLINMSYLRDMTRSFFNRLFL